MLYFYAYARRSKCPSAVLWAYSMIVTNVKARRMVTTIITAGIVIILSSCETHPMVDDNPVQHNTIISLPPGIGKTRGDGRTDRVKSGEVIRGGAAGVADIQ